MTSEGGGAVAFPVMTLALNIPPPVARDFSLMIQSCGEEIFKNIENLKSLKPRYSEQVHQTLFVHYSHPSASTISHSTNLHSTNF